MDYEGREQCSWASQHGAGGPRLTLVGGTRQWPMVVPGEQALGTVGIFVERSLM